MKPRNETSLGPCGFVAMLCPQSTAIHVTLASRDTRTPRCCRTNQTRSVNALAADDRSVLSQRGLATSADPPRVHDTADTCDGPRDERSGLRNPLHTPLILKLARQKPATLPGMRTPSAGA